MSTGSNTQTTEGQEKQLKRIIEDTVCRARKEVSVDKDAMQRLLGNGGKFQDDIVASLIKHSVADDRFGFLVSFEIAVPKSYDHGAQLATFAKYAKGEKFYYYNDAITDKNFARATNKLVPGRTYWAKIFGIRQRVSSEDCRENKGTHRALDRFKYFAGQVSKNNSRTCYILKCDIKKFFANIDHQILIKILERHIDDEEILWLLNKVISSFHTEHKNVGLPLGNLTSQLLVNVYMHEFDMFMKQELRVKYYMRYADDFVILSDNKDYLNDLLLKIDDFLRTKLKLNLHENKVYVKTYASGVDFLGWTHFPHHRQLRTTTKRKIIRKLKGYPKQQTVASYRGLLGHGDTYNLKKRYFPKIEL